jgi:ribonuclease P/MRP protein subunit POP5
MKLLPSLRQKKRYLVFEVISEKKFSRAEIEKEVNQALLNFLGQLGVAQAAPLFIKEKFNQPQQRFILKINHQHPNQAKAALALIKKIKNTNVIFKSLTTTGTLKKAHEVLKK